MGEGGRGGITAVNQDECIYSSCWKGFDPNTASVTTVCGQGTSQYARSIKVYQSKPEYIRVNQSTTSTPENHTKAPRPSVSLDHVTAPPITPWPTDTVVLWLKLIGRLLLVNLSLSLRQTLSGSFFPFRLLFYLCLTDFLFVPRHRGSSLFSPVSPQMTSWPWRVTSSALCCSTITN